MKVKLRKIFDEHPRVSFATEGPSLTVQDAKDECDVNYIIESYVKRGIVPPQAQSYMDCTSVADYQQAMMIVAECKSNFETLPSKMRDEFKTVENYLSYISDENNLKDCIEKGLIDKASVSEEKLNEIYKASKTLDEETPLPQKPVSEQVSSVGEEVSANS